MKRLPYFCVPARGFTLIEVLIAIFIGAVGLFGLAKMQALAISSSQNSGKRSLIASQVGSLASSMHANRAYWAQLITPLSFTATGTAITDATGVLDAVVASCAEKCTPEKMAAYNVKAWVTDMNQQFPTYSAKINCTAIALETPVSCQLYVTWLENTIAISKGTQAGTPSQKQSFSIFIEP